MGEPCALTEINHMRYLECKWPKACPGPFTITVVLFQKLAKNVIQRRAITIGVQQGAKRAQLRGF